MAQAISFLEHNIVLGANQPEYNPLPAFHNASSNLGEMVTCWKLTEEELEEVKKTGVIWFVQLTFNTKFQPVQVHGLNPVTSIILSNEENG